MQLFVKIGSDSGQPAEFFAGDESPAKNSDVTEIEHEYY